MNNQNQTKQLNFLEMILLHLVPGIIILLEAIFFANPHFGLGLSIYLSVMLAILFGLIPVELGILGFIARKEKTTIKKLIRFTESMSVKRTLLWAIPCMIIAFIVFGIVGPIEHPLWKIFDWVPKWFRLDQFSISAIPKGEALLTLTLGVILNGVLGPFVEELYFRGFLLPRMGKCGKLAPLVNTVLFSLYHFFTPWENITRILAMLPYISAVYYKRNIKIGMIVHLTLNTLSMIGMIVMFVQ